MTLDACYRGQVWHWMPEAAPDPMQIIVGAILVQHTTWTNAERALEALRLARGLDPAVIAVLPPEELADLVRVSGTPSVKARRLVAVCRAILRAGGVDALLAQPAAQLRQTLLGTHGIGPETADAIALYAAGKPVFVIDAYTRRLFGRLGHCPVADTYEGWQRYFEGALAAGEPARGAAARVDIFRRYHGYIVLHGKAFCRAVPRCTACPLVAACAEGRMRTSMAPPSS